MSSGWEWQFGGALRHLPVPTAWAVLGLLGVLGAALVIWLYRRTLRNLSPAARWMLTALRLLIVAAVLLCLANPAQVRRKGPAKGNRDTMVVLVDRSASMNGQDYRGASRLANAARNWKQHEAEACAAFSKIQYARFATALEPAGDLAGALAAQEPGPETHLYAALEQTLASSPGAIVCLTDGLDTTQAKADELLAEAQRRAVPLYFVAGKNRTRASELLNIREIKAPPSVLRKTQFTVSALLEAAVAQSGELPVELWSSGKMLASAQLPMRAGANTVPWTVTVSAAEPGAMPLEIRAGMGVRQQVASCTTQVVDRATVDVLYYQGALQWGYRFLLAALQADPSFRLTGILNPALGVKMSSGGDAALQDLPEDVQALKRFQIIVLAHVFANQLTAGQQRALIQYAREGGGLLFIAPDTNVTQQFAGSALEQMLPVSFDRAAPEDAAEAKRRNFQQSMASSSAGSGESPLLDDPTARRQAPPLQAFAVPPGAPRSAITALFTKSDAAALPRFCMFAQVRGTKPAATVLAQSEDGKHVLLARQQFGDGFTAVMATDLLWRWKMAIPSESHAVEKFWQQLLLSLAPLPGQGLRLVKMTDSPAIKTPVALKITGSGSERPPDLEAISPAGAHQPIALQWMPEDSTWSAAFTPALVGRWEVSAKDATGNQARLIFPIAEKLQTIETLNLPPDLEAMRRLAETTGGALIGDAPAFRPAAAEGGDATPVLQVQPLWNSGWLLGILMALYAAELITRRFFKLL